ncbi:MAG TPA: ATP-binding cassette domain-containing protein [Candidatus Marinimicrobia bacterium]|nr:ATP-binding cassette domain-containing protein [Candidatus Neomarinimicrobiota bacterium]HIB33608.1 ATP-binding cassette domain-containing protein [Candidatus Neomarinimicrobiota bacterium]
MTDHISFNLNFQKFENSMHISFPPGLHVIYGESGSGKSQFIYSLSGLKDEQESNFTFTNIVIPESCQIVFQNPENQILSNTLESELAFASECQSIHPQELQEKLALLKSDLPFVNNWNRHPETLSGGQMEMLNLVTAFSTNPRLVFIDDGLSFLNDDSKENWVDWIRNKISRGKIVLWFTSDPTDLAFGDTKWELSLSSFQSLDMIPDLNRYSYQHPKGDLAIKFNNLLFSYSKSDYPVIDNWNCNISQARSIGLIGKNGKGKTTLSKLITGLILPEKGEIQIHLKKKVPRIAVLDQFPERMLGANTLESLVSNLVVNQKMNSHLVNKCINRLYKYQINWEIIKDQSALDIPWSSLRLALIIILAHCEYDVLILDEPTFGLGWKQKMNLSRFFQEILINKYLILISHDKVFVSDHCDYIYDIDAQIVTRNKTVLINEK